MRRNLRLPQELGKLDRFDLLILNDLDSVPRDQAETLVLFELIVKRYERRGLTITANTLEHLHPPTCPRSSHRRC